MQPRPSVAEACERQYIAELGGQLRGIERQLRATCVDVEQSLRWTGQELHELEWLVEIEVPQADGAQLADHGKRSDDARPPRDHRLDRCTARRVPRRRVQHDVTR